MLVMISYIRAFLPKEIVRSQRLAFATPLLAAPEPLGSLKLKLCQCTASHDTTLNAHSTLQSMRPCAIVLRLFLE
jgi:hypothetical protein